jgi:uncharacterized protein YjbJ (UPF0337 family)
MDNNLDQTKGRIKQAAGDLTGDDDLKKEGKADVTAGKIKKLLKNAQDKLSGLVDKVKEKFSKH